MGLIYEYSPKSISYQLTDTLPTNGYKLVLFDIGGVLLSYENALQYKVKDFSIIQSSQKLLREASKKYKVGLLSNFHRGIFEELLAKDIIPNIKYEHIFLSEDVKMKKPDGELFKYIENNVAVKVSEILFIDDQEKNINEAQKRGWGTYFFDRLNPEKSSKELTNILELE